MAEQFNLKDVLGGLTEAQKGGVFPEQTVKMKCTEAEYTISSGKGTKGWKYTGEILEGENQGETVEGTAWWSTRTKNSIPFFLGQMYALGITDEMMMGSADSPQLSNDQIAAAMVGAIFEGRITIDVQKNGRKRNQLLAETFLGAEDDEAGDIGGGDDELDFSEFDSPAAAAAVDVSADDPEIAAANAATPPDGTAGDQPVDLPETADDDLESLWEPSK